MQPGGGFKLGSFWCNRFLQLFSLATLYTQAPACNWVSPLVVVVVLVGSSWGNLDFSSSSKLVEV